MYSSKFLFISTLFILLSCALCNTTEEQSVPEIVEHAPVVDPVVETVQLNEEDVPESMRAVATLNRHSDHDPKSGKCKKYDCEKKQVCEPFKCKCALKKYKCNCVDTPYKCCYPKPYPCNCFDEKYACNCTKKKYNCKCEKKPYKCNCTVHKEECNCKTHKYVCGYEKGHDHGPYGDHDHPDDKKSTRNILDDIVNRKYLHQHPKYCYKKICDVCEKEKCDTCYEWKCKKCYKEECETCTHKKCLGKCYKQHCGTCYDKVCQICTDHHCEVCTKCKKVLAGCQYFLVDCDHSHKDSH